MAETAGQLKLLAQDADDLQILSAALQDAVGKIGDIRWEPAARRLTIALNRFRWESDKAERIRSAVQVGSALSVQARRLRPERKDAVIELLAMTFEPGEAPGGAIRFEFAGGGDLKVEVECVDVILADLSAAWPARRKPAHEDGR